MITYFKEGIIGIKKNEKWGFINENGKEICPPLYDEVSSFNEGLAGIKNNGKWGFVNKNGKEICPPLYNDASSFNEGFAAVKKNNDWFLINNKGIECLQLLYDEVLFYDVYIVRKNDKWGFIDHKGKIIIPVEYNLFRDYDMLHDCFLASKEGKYGIINYDGKIICKVEYDTIFVKYMKEVGMYALKKEGKMLLMNPWGQLFIPTAFDSLWHIEDSGVTEVEEYCLIMVKSEGKFGLYYGNYELVPAMCDSIVVYYNDEKTLPNIAYIEGYYQGISSLTPPLFGKQTIKSIEKEKQNWDYIIKLSDNVNLLVKNNKLTICDASYNRKSQVHYNDWATINEGTFAVLKGDKWGLVDTTGKEICPNEYQEPMYIINGIAAVKKGNKWGYINKKGAVIVPIKYDSVCVWGFPAIFENNKWSILNSAELIKGNTKYDKICCVSNGLYKVKRDGKYGYINIQGNEIISPKYDSLTGFNEFNFAETFNEGKFGIVNSKGHEVLQTICDSISGFEYYQNIPTKIAFFSINGRWGVLDNYGISKILVGIHYADKSKYPNIFKYKDNKNSIRYVDSTEFSEYLINSRSSESFNYYSYSKEEINQFFETKTKVSDNDIATEENIHFVEVVNNYAATTKNDKWGYKDLIGREICPFIYAEASSFSEGFGAVKFDDKWGFINTTGKEVIPIIYDDVDNFREGLAKVELNYKCGFIDTKGTEVIPLVYTFAANFKNGKAKVTKDGKTFYINTKGECVEGCE